MVKRRLLLAGGCTVLALTLCGQAAAQERQVYRYIDASGRVVYSDRPPVSGAKDIQTKRVWGNTIETSELPIAVQQASERFPVTLYTFACGLACDNAQALLNRRGVPFATVNVEEGDGAQKLQHLTGELSAPVLQVGDKLIGKGFHEAKWNALLDQAGYPKSPARRTTQAQRPLTDPAADQAARTAAAAVQPAAPATAPAPTGSYPK